ncbi:hypothetical protein JUJ52_17715 [Virgibacillus sp. AGTR]|uniref:hypothetical protein n=1 Tax=Virgibacillus sp. AGTR TaxID=2812055 RepID=UPI001D16ABB7|nr:hypothetical protein [Virgibacillus sp. AGTR]MCC2251788.1 hypothetical protein [Virgibacillus sp. AGTR]
MKGFLKLILASVFFVMLIGCSDDTSKAKQEYDELLTAVSEYHSDFVYFTDLGDNPRELADLTVWENGRYVRIGFLDEEDGELVGETYYEIVEDNIEVLDEYGENAVKAKTPDYQERRGRAL